MAAIEVSDLSRTYHSRASGQIVALDRVDLTVPAGEVHGLLGPNGAGKTTLCKILSTVLVPTSGVARVCGLEVVADTAAVRPLIGIVFGGERGLYGRLSARQNLQYWSALYRQPRRRGHARVEELLDRVGLAGQADARVETYSRGMKQRLHLARGLIGDPRVLLLDEPTTGMDPVAARDFRALVDELRDAECTVLLTTHDMAEAEAVCDRVSLIDSGRVLGTEDPAAIGSWLSTYERVRAVGVPEAVIAELRALPGVAAVHRVDAGKGTGRSVRGDVAGGEVIVETDAGDAARRVLQHFLDEGITSVGTVRPTLEEVYLHVIGGRGMEVT